MSDNVHQGDTLQRPAGQAQQEPLTLKDRLIGLGLALVFAAVGTGMMLRPEWFEITGEGPSGRRGRMIVWLLKILWSRPIGAVLILLALLMIWGCLSRRSQPAAAQQ